MTTKQQLPHANNQRINRALDHRLLLYAVAAGAALASTTPSHAEVIFTPSSAILTSHGFNKVNFPIDLDNDGSVDLTLFIGGCLTYSCGLMLQAKPTPPNQTLQWAPKAGSYIGGSRAFISKNWVMAVSFPGDGEVLGPFANTRDRFLGVKLLINGEVHYGWIGFQKVIGESHYPHLTMSARLAGWAYETNPDTPIVTGDTGADAPRIQPTSLEVLSSGHTGIAERRKRTTSH
jgi:hypothetical protein